MKNVLVYRSYSWSKVSNNNLKKIKSVIGDTYICYDTTNSSDINEDKVFTYKNSDYLDWGYYLPSREQIEKRKPSRISLSAGYCWYNPEYAFLQTIKRFNIEADYYWNMEDDVFSKDWSKTLELLEQNKSDFIGTYLSSMYNENSYYNFSDADFNVDVPEIKRYRSYGVLQRYSHELVQNLLKYYEIERFHAFYEYSVPTIAALSGLTLDDFNNQGKEIYSFRTLRGAEFDSHDLNKNRDFIKNNYIFHPIRNFLL